MSSEYSWKQSYHAEDGSDISIQYERFGVSLIISNMVASGPVQQEGERLHCYHGECRCKLSFRNRGIGGSAAILQHHAKSRSVYLFALLQPTPWVWNWGIDAPYAIYYILVIDDPESFYVAAILLYPSKMLYPGVLPLISMFDAFYQHGSNARKKLKLFYIAFFA